MFVNLVSGTNSGVASNVLKFTLPYLQGATPGPDGIIHAVGTAATAPKAFNQIGYFPYYTGNSTYAVVAATVNNTAGTNAITLDTVAVDSTANQPAPVGLAFADHPDPAAMWQGWDVDILSFTSNGQNNYSMGGQKLAIGTFPGSSLVTGTVSTASGLVYGLTVTTANSANIVVKTGISPCPGNFPVGLADFDGVANPTGLVMYPLFVDTA